ncbi:MAG: prepilin-type N-terminal cleavage/methylation domain-containing protein [Gammaproteobacteria bacterium]|nr:prepilin-type N-terminal cleavage/methylation domain-containing protein [Gammaproteobacteria bacterium]
MKSKQFTSGFTLIELIVVLILVGVLSLYAASRFFSTTSFDQAGFAQQSLAAIRYAQKLAISSGCDIRLTFTASSIALHKWVDTSNNRCDSAAPSATITPVSQPGGGDFSIQAPTGISVTASSAAFYFDRIGIPFSIGGTKLVAETTVDIGTETISIAPETGFVRCTPDC